MDEQEIAQLRAELEKLGGGTTTPAATVRALFNEIHQARINGAKNRDIAERLSIGPSTLTKAYYRECELRGVNPAGFENGRKLKQTHTMKDQSNG